MAYRDRDREEEFRGGAEERGSGPYGRSDYEERNRGPQQFGREHETGGRGQGWQGGSQGYGGQSREWSQGTYGQPGSERGGFDRESGSWRSPQGYESRGYESSGYGAGRREERFGRGSEGFDRFQGFSGGQGYGSSGRYGQSFGSGAPQYGRGFEGESRQMQGFRGGYSEEQFGATGRTRGRFTGRGPKGYTRSDDRIREDVSDRLQQHGDIDASEVVVMVEAAEVTLEGTVPDRWTKRLAEDVVESTPGVKQVNNRLRIAGLAGETEQIRRSTSAAQTAAERAKQGSTTRPSSRT